MNESVPAALSRAALPSRTEGLRESSRRILRQVIHRYTLRLSAITGDNLTERQALAATAFSLSLSGAVILAECIPALAVCVLVLAASSRTLASSETPSAVAKRESASHLVEKD